MTADLATAPGAWHLPLFLAGIGGAVLVFSAVLTAIARRVAPRVGFVDHPGGHKSHHGPMPYGGGSAIFLAAWLALNLIDVHRLAHGLFVGFEMTPLILARGLLVAAALGIVSCLFPAWRSVRGRTRGTISAVFSKESTSPIVL